MRLRPLDWLLLVVAVAAVLAGLVLGPPICNLVIGPVGYTPPAGQCAGFRFPIEAASGAIVAVAALLTIALRLRRNSN
jgi:hypothetical protein